MKKSLLALAVLSAMSLNQTALAAWHYDVEDTSSIEGLTDGDTVFGGSAINSLGEINKNVEINVTKTSGDTLGGFYLTGISQDITANVQNSKVLLNGKDGETIAKGDVYGGSYIQGEGSQTATLTLNAINTSVELNSGNVSQHVVGGHRVIAYNGKYNVSTQSSSVIVNGGKTNYSVIGGTLMRISGGANQNPVGSSTTQTTSVTVNGGTVAGIIGGSVSQSMDDKQTIITEVGTTNINVTGGTINKATMSGSGLIGENISLIGGGLVTFRGGEYDSNRSTSTNEVNINISGGDFAGDIVAGAVIKGNSTGEDSASTGKLNVTVSSQTNDIYLGGVAIDTNGSKPTNGDATITLKEGADVGTVVLGGKKVEDKTVEYFYTENTQSTVVFDSKNISLDGINTIDENNKTQAIGSSHFNDEHASVDEAVDSLTNFLKDSKVTEFTLQDGESNGSVHAVLQEDGTYAIDSRTLNAKTAQFGQNAHALYMTWAMNKSDFNERMGELRDSPNQAGVWARVQGGEQKFKKTDMDFQTFQFGIDRRIEALDNAYLGVAFSYSDADLDYEQGSGTNKLYSLGVYGSWLGETGSYLDLIAKIGRLESDAKIAGTSGEYDMTAYSISAETGHRFMLAPSVFLEPQFEVAYGYAEGSDFKTISATHQVTDSKLDSTDSLTGRIGVRAGWTDPQKRGSLYAHASMIHEFNGDVTYHRGSETYDEDFSDTWTQYGIGGHFNVTDTTYVYGDVRRTTGGDVSEPWRVNLGVRYSF